ncbi:phytanoyl-CoA dioxygenase family protein [Pendulispora brunnea]|uniref:Phytanoyl-CoA dioxygenase family protein n=1 Tax=Pendulispora brunnea TaxID=2905690 RepID=A0ABZ2K098_9BACT
MISRASFERDGFLVLPDFVSPEACDALRTRALEWVARGDPSEFSVFSAYLAGEAAATEYIHDSADKIRFFFEGDAFDAGGNLTRPKELALCKIGHALHDCDPVFDAFSRSRQFEHLAKSLGLRKPLLAQSMYLFKQPGIGAEIGCHQDASFIYTEPTSVVGLWTALEDATVDNGCMWALPGGHRSGLHSRFVRNGRSDEFVVLDPTPWPDVGFVPLPAKKGTVIVLHGLLPHASKANTSPHSRHAYTLHLIDGDLPYAADNWLQRPADNPFRGF